MKNKGCIVLTVLVALGLVGLSKNLLASSVPEDYATIQEALDHAVEGETILVANGTYQENLQWPNVNNITLRSRSGIAEACVIDGSLGGSPVITANVSTVIRMTLKDLTIRGGTQGSSYYSAGGISVNAPTPGSLLDISGCVLRDNIGIALRTIRADVTATNNLITENLQYPHASALTVHIEDGNTVLVGNEIKDNELAAVGIYAMYSPLNVVVERNSITGNMHGLLLYSSQLAPLTATVDQNLVAYNGYALPPPSTTLVLGIMASITHPESELTIADNTVLANNGFGADNASIGVMAGGAGLITITGNRISDEIGRWVFGLALIPAGGYVEAHGNLIAGINAEEGAAVGLQPVENSSGITILTNNIVVNNAVPTALAIGDNEVGPNNYTHYIINNTIAANTGIGIGSSSLSPVVIANCIVWDNGDDLDGVTATYSDISDGDPGEGNISQDPLFVNPGAMDFHIRPGSPCIDRGTNAAPNLPAFDYDGDPRIVNGIVDMGMDEYIGNTPIGTNVEVTFPNTGVKVTFVSVSQRGQTTVEAYIGPEPSLPEGYSHLSAPVGLYQVATSATFSGSATVCVTYDDPPPEIDESWIKLMHKEDTTFVDRTISTNPAQNRVCAQVTSLSEFTLAWKEEEPGPGWGAAQTVVPGPEGTMMFCSGQSRMINALAIPRMLQP